MFALQFLSKSVVRSTAAVKCPAAYFSTLNGTVKVSLKEKHCSMYQYLRLWDANVQKYIYQRNVMLYLDTTHFYLIFVTWCVLTLSFLLLRFFPLLSGLTQRKDLALLYLMMVAKMYLYINLPFILMASVHWRYVKLCVQSNVFTFYYGGPFAW